MKRGRSLITDILTVQLLITGVITVIALAGLTWTSRAVIRNNLNYWAEQWAGELNELGAPFYRTDHKEATLEVERFIQKYPEIRRVTWYRPDGSVFTSLDNAGNRDPRALPLKADIIAELSEKAGASPAFLLKEDVERDRRFRLSGPIWAESFANDGLFDVARSAPTKIELLGFVSVDIDFSTYQSAFSKNLAIASIALIALLFISWIVGHALLRRALRPLSELQEPLAQIARGTMDVNFPTTRHRETRAIVAALRDTLAALQKREQHLMHIADHDAVTGLFSRHKLVSELDAEIELCATKGVRSALCFVDLDQFKYINDTCGHPAGDQLLRLAAQQLREAVRNNDFVARFGGDEFVILLRNVSKPQARAVAEKVLVQMRSISHVEQGHVFHLQCSIGVTAITSARFASHEVLAQADMACQTAKTNGRNRVEFYNVSGKLNERMAQDIHWTRSIRKALENNEFVLHYQPLMHIQTRTISHYEALLRLQTSRGLIGPQAFLPAVARFGLMGEIDHWVVQHAIKALAEFGRAGPRLCLSVNLTRFSFEDEGFASTVQDLLTEYGVSGDQVCFEITEQMAVRFAARTDKQIAALRDLGCLIAVDDFGTGYSSFSYLKRLPADYLKIDGSFIRELTRSKVDQSMVRMIGEVARAAGLQTVAEYVESAAAMDLLERYGIDYAQGFYIGRATPTPKDLREVEPALVAVDKETVTQG